jgi:hypothetical protein
MAPRNISIGRIYGRIGAALKGEPRRLLTWTLLFALLPIAAATILLDIPIVTGRLQPWSVPYDFAILTYVVFGTIVATPVLLAACLVVGAPGTLANSGWKMLRFWPMIAIVLLVNTAALQSAVILQSMGLTWGLLLLIPNMWLACRLAVVTPPILFESETLVGAYRRSFALTRGRRWSVLLFVAPLYFGGLLAEIVAQIIAAHLPEPLGPKIPISGPVFACTISTAVYLVASLGCASLFVELKAVRLAEEPDDAAANFA